MLDKKEETKEQVVPSVVAFGKKKRQKKIETNTVQECGVTRIITTTTTTHRRSRVVHSVVPTASKERKTKVTSKVVWYPA